MSRSIHGHEVLDLLRAQAMTRAALLDEMSRRFGPDARFHTCSLQGMTAVELVAFFEARGKVRFDEGALAINPANVCQHGDDHHH